MTTTTFTDQETRIVAAWLNDTNTMVYKNVVNVRMAPYSATGDGVTDDAPAFNAATQAILASGKSGTLFVPKAPVGYLLNSRWKIQNTYALNQFLQVVGEGSGNQSVAYTLTSGSLIVGNTGGIIIDCAGGNNISFQDIGLYSGTSNPSTIGMLFQRTSTDAYAANIRLVRVGIGITPNAAANGALGTFAVINKSGEHHHYYDSWFYADRPHLADGVNFYPTLKSPDYAVAAGTLSLNYFDNCAFLAASGAGSEIRTGLIMEYRGGYFLATSGQSGVTFFGSNLIKVDGVNIELSGGGTPAALVNVLNNTSGLVVRASTPITNLTGVLLTNGAQLFGCDIQLFQSFQKVVDLTGGSGGGQVTGGRILYNAVSGHTVPATGMFGTTLTNVATGETEFRGSACSVSFTIGVPNPANGQNGDFYFRGDGTQAASTLIYHKQGGAWIPLITT